MRKPSHYYDHDRRRARIFSGILHLCILLLAICLPDFMFSQPPEPEAISIDVLPISEISNIKPSEQPPAPTPPKPEQKPAEKPPEPPAKPAEHQNSKATPPVKTNEPPPPPPPEKIAEKPAPKQPEKPKPPEPPKKKPKPQTDDLDAVLKSVAAEAKKENAKTPDKTPAKDTNSAARSKSDRFDPTQQVSESVKDAIRSQIAHCWSMPAGALDAQNLVVTLHLQLEQNGTVTQVELASSNQSRYSSDSFFRAAADSAMRAVRECSPLKDLPADKYGAWRDMELTFDPKDI